MTSKKDDQKQEERWIDYVEGELDPSLKSDFEKLLSHSKEDLEMVENLKRLRSSLRRADPLGVEASSFNEGLFSKIMSEVEVTPMHPKWRVKLLRPQVLGPIAASVVLVFAGIAGLKGVGPQPQVERPVMALEINSEDWLLQASLSDPTLLAEAMNDYESGDEFVLDAWAHQMDGLSEDEISATFDSLVNE